MSWEGYYEYQCMCGNVDTCDAYEAAPKACTECRGRFYRIRQIDQTNETEVGDWMDVDYRPRFKDYVKHGLRFSGFQTEWHGPAAGQTINREDGMRDRFGNPVTEDQARSLMKRERPGDRARRSDPEPNGYAGLPGAGPAGETCRTCRHLVRVLHAKTYLKCALRQADWTGGRATDILAFSPACPQWTSREVSP